MKKNDHELIRVYCLHLFHEIATDCAYYHIVIFELIEVPVEVIYKYDKFVKLNCAHFNSPTTSNMKKIVMLYLCSFSASPSSGRPVSSFTSGFSVVDVVVLDILAGVVRLLRLQGKR